jgi:hypothetical protein
MAGSDFSTTDLTGLDLGSGANLMNTNLSGANLTGSYIHDLANSRGLALSNEFQVFTRSANLSNGPANVLVGPGVSFYMMDLSNWNLSGLNLRGAFFEGTNLRGANLANANLAGAYLFNTTLTNANLSNTNLTMAVEGGYSRVTLNWGWPGAQYQTQAPLDTTCPPGSVIGQMTTGKNNGIPGLEALGFNCVPITAQGTTGWQGVQHVDVLDNYSMGKYTSYCGSGQAAIGIQAHSDGNRVQNVGPICATFPTQSNANAPQMTLTNNGLASGGTYGKYPNGVYTCPVGQWLVGVQAQISVPNGSVFMINQAICETWTQLSAVGSVSGGIVGQPILSPGWALVNGYLVGPGVNLANVNLSGANLTGVNFAGTNLSGANLTNATLDYVSSRGIIGVPQLSFPFGVYNGYLLGPKISLIGADLSNSTMKYWQLQGATFVNTNFAGTNMEGIQAQNAYFDSSTNLTNVNLYGSNLSGANMSWHDYTSVNLSSANCTGANFTSTTLNGGGNRGVGNSWTMNNTNFTNATIVFSTLTGNLSTTNYAGNFSYRDNFLQWILFPQVWNYSNGTIHY